MIIDTDVLIWDMRGNEKARTIISKSVPFGISVVTHMELIRGMKNKNELRTYIRQLKKWSVTILQLDREISTRAMFYMEEFSLSHGIEMADALIAATAIESNNILLTSNEKHYRQVPNIQLRKFAP